MSGEYISRETLRGLMYTEAFERDTGLQRWDSGLWIRYKLFENCLEAIPAADVVEVVRCGECKYYNDKLEMYSDYVCTIRHYCDGSPIIVGKDDFCSSGRRKDGGQDDV